MIGSLALALLFSTSGWEYTGGVGVLLTLWGVWLRWRSQWDVAHVEEAVKNEKLSGETAHRRIRWIHLRAMLLIAGGLGVLLIALFGLSR